MDISIKILPEYVVYYKEGVIKDFNEIINFILTSADECRKNNPDIKCLEPDYCFVSYLDGEYKEKDIAIMYAQAVVQVGKESETIKFKKLESTLSVTAYHHGSYKNIRDTYQKLLDWVTESNYVITEPIRERYIDGMWNKESEDEWLTEIQIPVKEKDKI